MGKRHNLEESIGKLRKAEIVLAQGGTTRGRADLIIAGAKNIAV